MCVFMICIFMFLVYNSLVLWVLLFYGIDRFLLEVKVLEIINVNGE